MARTTPAQKPRGEQSTIFRSGLADAEKEDIRGSRGPNHPQPAGGERPIRVRTWGCFWALSRHFSRPLRQWPLRAYIGAEFPSSPMTADFASKKRWARHKGDLP